MSNDFRALARKKEFSSDHYPHAESGVRTYGKMMTSVRNSLIIGLVLLLVVLVRQMIVSFVTGMTATPEVAVDEPIVIYSNPQPASGGTGLDFSNIIQTDTIGQAIMNFMKVMADIVFWAVLVIFLIYAIRGLVQIIHYFTLLFFRQRNHERNVFKNDREANRLNSKLKRNIAVRRRIRELKRKLNKSDTGPSYSEAAELNMLKSLKRLLVQINTRESLDKKGRVDTQYRVVVELPDDNETQDKLRKEIEHLNDVASRIIKNKVSFGKGFVSTTADSVTFRAFIDEPDPYAYGGVYEKIQEMEKIETESEYSFDLGLFVDNRAKVEEVSELAREWCESNQTKLTRFLQNAKLKVDFNELKISTRNALFTYSLAEDTEFPNTDKLSEQIDKYFKIDGTMINIERGDLKVTLPLDKQYAVPIDVATVFKKVYG